MAYDILSISIYPYISESYPKKSESYYIYIECTDDKSRWISLKGEIFSKDNILPNIHNSLRNAIRTIRNFAIKNNYLLSKNASPRSVSPKSFILRKNA